MAREERRDAGLDRFYDLLAELAKRIGGPRTLSCCDRSTNWPERGVYFFFEDNETRDDRVSPRVVRIGTHALRPSRSTLWGRLSQHRGSVGGSMPGGGNHRASVFRLHVGSALLSTGEWPNEIAQSWSRLSNAPRDVRVAEYPLERAVSQHIGSMPLVWLGVDDPRGALSDRGVIERGSIALLSNSGKPSVDESSPNWLGRRSSREAIRDSGLWNVNHVKEEADLRFLDALERWIRLAGPA